MTLDNRFPASARLVWHEQSIEEGISLQDFLAKSRARVEREFADPQRIARKVVGVQGANELATLEIIFGLVELGAIPAPFAPDAEEATLSTCLERLGAAACWRAPEGWISLKGDREWAPGFELVMHSSGSTGLPKPMGIRLEAMVRNATDVSDAIGLSEDDRHLGTMQICYMSGLFNATLLPLLLGSTSICAPVLSPITLASFLHAIERHQPTVVWLNPMMVRMLSSLSAVSRNALDSVRHIISCTAPLPKEFRRKFEDRFARPILQSYGLCETLITTIEHPHSRKDASVGRPVGPKGSVSIAEDGRIVISNGALMAGYLDSTEPSFVGDASPLVSYLTNDLGQFDEAGDLSIIGRSGYVINRGGVKFAPEIVEAKIAAEEGVVDCAIAAIEDLSGGVQIIALVVGEIDTQGLLARLSLVLPSAQCPSRIVPATSIPRTTSGKVDRTNVLKEVTKCL